MLRYRLLPLVAAALVPVLAVSSVRSLFAARPATNRAHDARRPRPPRHLATGRTLDLHAAGRTASKGPIARAELWSAREFSGRFPEARGLDVTRPAADPESIPEYLKAFEICRLRGQISPPA